MQILIFLICFFSAFTVKAKDLNSSIFRTPSNPIALAVVPFQNSNKFTDLAKVISGNMELTGEFSTIDRSAMLALPGPNDTIYYRDWRSIGAEYVIVGGIQEDSEGVLVRYGLHSTAQQKVLFAERIPGDKKSLPDIGHYISDRVYEALTGIKGIAHSRLLYVTTETRGASDKTFRLILSDSDGGRPRTIFQSSEPISNPVWSPVGDKIAYMAFRGNQAGIYLQELATGYVQKISDFTGMNTSPVFSPDGRSLAITLSRDGNPEIYTVNLQTGTMSRLTNHPSVDFATDWSPDGKSILITSTRLGMPSLFELTISSKKIKSIHSESAYSTNGVYSPDGKSIIYVGNDSRGETALFAISKTNAKPKLILNSEVAPIADERPSIAPNGTMVLIDTGFGGFVRASLTGDTVIEMISTKTIGHPAWSPFFH